MRRVVERAWRRRGWLARILYPLSLVYAAGMAARGWAYRAGVFRRYRLPAPLIVVGNLCVGGSGKTPLVMALVDALRARGWRPGVIARGLRAGARAGRDWPREAGVDVDAAAAAFEVGDEAALIARRCGVPVFAGPNRRAAAEALLARHRCDILISDDGFQHLQLRRDLDIVVVDARRRFGNGWRLPAGPLRESPAAIRRAALVVVNHSGGDGGGDNDDGDGAPIAHPNKFRMRVCIDRAVQLVHGGGREKPLREFASRHSQAIHAVAGLGDPSRFFRQLRAHGIDARAHAFPDHHRFTAADFAFAAAADTVLMTEKDAVKCEALVAGGELAGEYWVAPLRVELPAEFIDAVCAKLGDVTVADATVTSAGTTVTVTAADTTVTAAA
ncbi:MAG: tetraacyldisaccharide 4'-kinase [Gammaproteobacteria bacterium]|nr:tetraacyldisaccharide 4'-kinase [Gammaproteobacteria bacterium]